MVSFLATGTTCSSQYFEQISDQLQLDRFIDNITSWRREPGHHCPRCIHLSLVANSYQLNVTKFVRGLDLRENDSLKVEVKGHRAYISCTDVDSSHASNLLLSRAALVVFDGLMFTGCFFPIYVEEVNSVMIQNCIFR